MVAEALGSFAATEFSFLISQSSQVAHCGWQVGNEGPLSPLPGYDLTRISSSCLDVLMLPAGAENMPRESV